MAQPIHVVTQGVAAEVKKRRQVKCQEEMEQDRLVRDQSQVAAVEWVVATDKEWVVDKVEWAIEYWGREEIAFALPAKQKYLINKEFHVFK